MFAKVPSVLVFIFTDPANPGTLPLILRPLLDEKKFRVQVLLFDNATQGGYLDALKMMKSRGGWLHYRHPTPLPDDEFKKWAYRTVSEKHAGEWIVQLGATAIPQPRFLEDAVSLWNSTEDHNLAVLSLVGAQIQGEQKVLPTTTFGKSFLTRKAWIQVLSEAPGNLSEAVTQAAGSIYQCQKSLVNATTPLVPVEKTRPESRKGSTVPVQHQATFIVPTCRRPDLLRACLQALQTQVIPPGWGYDILVSGTPNDIGKNVATSFGARWVPSPTESVTTKLNTCLPETKAELILLADDDDIQPPTRLQAAVEAYQGGADWSGTGTLHFYHVAEDRIVRWTGKASLGLVGTSLSFSAKLLTKVGGWPERAKGKDGPMARRIQSLRPTPVFKDISDTMGFLLCQQHTKNLWKRPVLEKGQTKRRGKFDLIGFGPLTGVQMPSETLAALRGLKTISSTTRIYVTTYNRPQETLLLLQDLEREGQGRTLHVTVYDDGSPTDYSRVEAFLRQRTWSYVKGAHGGKRGYFNLGIRIFTDALKADPHGGYFLQDDIRLCQGFFDLAEQLWNEIPEENKATLFLFKDAVRGECAPWTAFKRVPAGNVDKTQWVDGVAFRFGPKFLQQIEAGIPPVPYNWFRDTTRGSGFGRQLSLALHNRGFGLYQTKQSLVVHSDSPSRLNPLTRACEPLPTINFVGGAEAVRTLQGAPLQSDTRKVVSLASIPSREKALEEVVRRILPQTDKLNVYLNGYGRTPEFLKHEKISVERSETCAFGDQGDAGKFYWADTVTGYHIVLDDDLAYPPDFVQTLIGWVDKYDRKAAVGCHGATLVEPFGSYYKSRRAFHYRKELAAPTPVHLLGTGCLCYHTNGIKVSRTDFKHPNMADIWFALLGQQQKVPFVCIPHGENWLTDLLVNQTESIWAASRTGIASKRNTAEVQTKTVRESLPWTIHEVKGNPTKTQANRKAAFLVPTTNRPQLLKVILKSLEAQEIPAGWSVEILVGGSPDDPGKEVAVSLGIQYIDVRAPYPGSKLNACAAATDAVLLLAADDDDLQDPKRLAETVKALDQGHEWVSTAGVYFYEVKTGKLAIWQGAPATIGTTTSLTNNLFRKVGGWPEVSRGKEGLLLQRVSKLGITCFDLGLTETVCTQHENNLWARPFPNVGERIVFGHFVVKGVENETLTTKLKEAFTR